MAALIGAVARARPLSAADGLLLEDERLPRFHAGHKLVKFFYGGVVQLPEYLVDARPDQKTAA
jgi:hypothetical protein